MDDVRSDSQIAETGGSSIGYRDLFKTGPGTLAGRYLRRFWQPVHTSRDLAPGQAKPIKIMSENLTLYRGKTGAAHVVGGYCEHRGAPLWLGWVENDDIRCVYHGWKYDGSGQCNEQPAEANQFCRLIKAKAYPTREYLGLIFIYMGEGAPPEFPLISEFDDEEFPRQLDADIWPCNNFLQLENAVDKVHTQFLHWQFGHKTPESFTAEEADYGMKLCAKGMSINGGAYDDGFIQLPNITEFAVAPRPGETVGHFSRGWRVPVDDNSSLRFNLAISPLKGEAARAYVERNEKKKETSGDKAQMSFNGLSVGDYAQLLLDGKEDMQRFMANSKIAHNMPHFYVVGIQDATVLAGIDQAPEGEYREHLGKTDVAVALFRKLWLQELRALAEGRPLRDWKRPHRLWDHMKQQTGTK